MEKLFFILNFLLSLVLYIFAPSTFSHTYCIVLLVIYSISSFWFIKKTSNGNYFNFQLLFLFSFLLVNFVYPVFIYPFDPLYFPVFKHHFNENIITKATALAVLGISSYLLGASFMIKEFKDKPRKVKIFNYGFFVRILIILSIFLMMIFLINVGDKIFTGQFGSTTETSPFYLTLFQVFFQLAIILEFHRNRNKFNGSLKTLIQLFNKNLLIIIIFYSVIFLYVGDRGPIIQLFIIVLVLYSLFIRKLNLRIVLMLLFVGLFISTFISYARTTDIYILRQGNTLFEYLDRGTQKMQVNSIYDIGMELIINNRNLYVGMDIANKEGFSYGKTMFPAIFAIVPMLPTYMSELFFNSLPSELSTGWIITVDGLGYDTTWGLGTNIIVDIYMNFGMIGVIILMFFLGSFVMYLQSHFKSNANIYIILAYVTMISFSIYLPRAAYFNPTRHVLWTLLVYYTLTLFISPIGYILPRHSIKKQ